MPVIVGLHLAVLAIIHARPGRLGLALWYLGPPLTIVLVALLLGGSLRSLQRRREGRTRWRLAGFIGLVGVILTLPIYDPYPSSHDGAPSSVQFRLPLDGPVTVAWGGSDGTTNYHIYLPDQRWAYDLLVASDGRTHRGTGAELTDYRAYGREVRAPAAGLVVAAEDGRPEVAIGETRWNLAGLGNHVVVEVAPSEFLFIGHLQPGSIAVVPGARVAAGQRLGLVGNSGNSSEPHVHLHLQDDPRPGLGEAIPFYFHRYRHAGQLVPRGMPEGGREDGIYVGDVVTQVE